MKRLLTHLSGFLGLLAVSASAQNEQLDPTAGLFSTNDPPGYIRGVNLSSFRGVPISNVANLPNGPSDGRAPLGATPGQFRGMVPFSGVTHPGRTDLTAGSVAGSYIGNAGATNLNLSRGTNTSGNIVLVLRAAQLGAPYVSRQVSVLFGAVITPPVATEGGGALPAGVPPEDYWRPEPYSTNSHATARYYWSAHAGAVFATQPGPVQVRWQKKDPSLTRPAAPAVENTDYVNNGSLFYSLTNVTYVVAATAIKPTRKIYWTEATFRATGKPVSVPTARVGAVVIAYSAAFPEKALEEYVALGQNSITDATNRLQELRTLWYDQQQGQIYAYNKEGRVFVELLGDVTGAGTRQHLGFELVDVFQQPTPTDLTAELGDKITAYADGTSDADLFPDPLLVPTTQPYLYRHAINGTERAEFYAARETLNQNDALVHWLESGVAGLRWPLIFGRYQLSWPTDVARYSHYVRPVVATQAEAKLTAVPMPTDNMPTIQYQDPLDQPRAKLTETFSFYTFLTPEYPAHRTLLLFASGDRISFERVFSWLDQGLKTPATLLAGTVATNLTRWNVAPPFSGSDIRNLAGFAAKLTAAADPVSAYLKSRLSPTTLAALAAYNPGTGAGATALQAGLVTDLGVILAGPGSIDPTTSGPAGSTWTPQASGNRAWAAIASSADGSKLVATVSGGQIYTSTNFGVSWIARESNRSWSALGSSVASSADGTKLVAVAENAQIYTSTDSGLSWIPRESNRRWFSVASSADGTKLVAGADFSRLYQSTDSGVTWTPRDSNRGWNSIAASADGMKWAATDRYGATFFRGKIYTSTDGGTTWTPRGTDQDWRSIASSADGTKLAAVVRNGQIYVSANSGITWSAREFSRQWQSIASSADGTRLAAVVNGGQIYASVNSGATWTAQDSNRNWHGIASSADGTKLAAIVNGGQIYTSLGVSAVPTGTDPYQFNRAFLSATYPDDIFHGETIVSTDTSPGPRLISQTVNVGDRSLAPGGELGTAGSNYLAGHIHIAAGDSYHPAAYKDPCRRDLRPPMRERSFRSTPFPVRVCWRYGGSGRTGPIRPRGSRPSIGRQCSGATRSSGRLMRRKSSSPAMPAAAGWKVCKPRAASISRTILRCPVTIRTKSTR